MKLDTAQFGIDYSKWKSLQVLGLNSWESAVRNVRSADRVVLFHQSLEPSSHQSMERAILLQAVVHHKNGDNVLILEADTYCFSEVDIFETSNQSLLRMFATADSETHPSIPIPFNLNSGVVYWPSNAKKALPVIEKFLGENWPETWAWYQHVWNCAYYAQFRTLESGFAFANEIPMGKYNYFRGAPVLRSTVGQAKIFHFFTSRGLRQAELMSSSVKRFGLTGYRVLIFATWIRDSFTLGRILGALKPTKNCDFQKVE